MSPLAYFRGRLIPASEAVVPVFDTGFMQGVTVAEQMRTFAGRLFRLPEHLQRLQKSLQIVGVDPGVPLETLRQQAEHLAAHNHALLPDGADLGLSLFVTPGVYPSMADSVPPDQQGPLVGAHTYPLPLASWIPLYQEGQSLTVSSIRQIPAACWPPELKCRSRMHYYLADQEARQKFPGSRALLLDEEEFVLEASTANLVIYSGGEFVSPPAEKILPGVSVRSLRELAEQLGEKFSHRDLTVEELFAADEVMLCSTSPCVWAVSQLNGKRLSDAWKAENSAIHRLRRAWSQWVGVDIQRQVLGSAP